MTTFATNELGKHPCKEGLNGVVGKPTTKGYDPRGLMQTSQNLR